MIFKVTVGYKTFIFTDMDKAVSFATMAKQTVTKGKYDKETDVTITLLYEDELREEEEE